MSRDASSVEAAPVTVSGDDVLAIDAELGEAGAAAPIKGDDGAAARKYYKDFVRRYYALYQSKFAPFRQATDKPLDRAAFDAAFVRSDDRVSSVGEGLTSFDTDRADLDALLEAMTSAAAAKPTTDRLSAYKKAKRQRVTRTIRSTRTETYCREYGYYIDACIDYGTRKVPQSRTVTESRLPKGVTSPPDLFRAYQDRFFALLTQRREENAGKASAERAEIEQDNIIGASRLWSAAYIVGAFISLMFLFLLIAIERHQRRIARVASNPDLLES
ncbi:hypothetical protein [Sphingomonas baiyangensis]|uniref:Uncharacterized protein n=1 Tax=Sphingomonas baiyangensis TaxID=2572576 RepID=A0A4V5PTX8_9SPHN|nr:hypothetical protein [Sphingomonas baiyangensis]TKD51848.1 hypothetical protein FBR43_14645 [Sphingomonas baiyangensis]